MIDFISKDDDETDNINPPEKLENIVETTSVENSRTTSNLETEPEKPVQFGRAVKRKTPRKESKSKIDSEDENPEIQSEFKSENLSFGRSPKKRPN